MNIYCVNCEHECSEAAQACPACGHPLGPPISPPIVAIEPVDQLAVTAAEQAPALPPVVVRPVQTVQTIEKTSKKWKVWMLLGAAMMVMGIASWVFVEPSLSYDDRQMQMRIGVFVGLAGFVLLVAAKLGAWWHHG